MNRQAFYDGQVFDAYNYMGCHKTKEGYRFTTFAPQAVKVALIGDFNNWTEAWMKNDAGFYTITVPEAKVGDRYKYNIYDTADHYVTHTDPYALAMELRPAFGAVITDPGAYTFGDEKWLKERSVGYDKPMNIYEIHAGSWRKPGPEANDWYTYRELADLLIPYLLENHYTHVEFMPLMEYPFDGSWGYQSTGFFAPTSRYGTPADLKFLIDQLHQAGIGAILDFVPVHFAVDPYSLSNYDGTQLYEYPASDVTNSEWGSRNFIYSRREVQCFMQSCANYWLEEFHFDGLRMDAVSRMIYWQGNEGRGENPNSLTFLKQMNQGLKERHPTAMLIAEDSSAFSGVTRPVAQGGLGFDYKWALGWMHDTLEYFQTDPLYRGGDYYKLTFAMTYFQAERYILEFSHDENVHGKATILQKMFGEYEGKWPQARALYMFMIMHPGKKLNFMGGELGQLREWDEAREQDWEMLAYPLHDAFHHYLIALNEIYTTTPALYYDYDPLNFRWLIAEQNDNCIYAMVRFGAGKGLACIFNFSGLDFEKYHLTLPKCADLDIVLHSDWEEWGGRTKRRKSPPPYVTLKTRTEIALDLPAFSGIMLEFSMVEKAKDETVNSKRKK